MYWVYKERKINGWISYVITPIIIAAPIKTASFVVAIIGNVVVKNCCLFAALRFFIIAWNVNYLYLNRMNEKSDSLFTPLKFLGFLL